MKRTNLKLFRWAIVSAVCLFILIITTVAITKIGGSMFKTFHVASDSYLETKAPEKEKNDPVETDKKDDEPTVPEKNDKEPGQIGMIHEMPTEYNDKYYDLTVVKEGTAPDGYIDNMVFLGDSTTYGMGYYDVLDWSQVWVPSSGTLTLSDTTADAELYDAMALGERPLADMCMFNKPKYLVITLGVNGMTYLDDNSFRSFYSKIIDTVQKANPDIQIILQSIYPVCSYCSVGDGFNNYTISHANELIIEIAYAYGLPYLDTYNAIINEYGYRPDEYSNGDGLHFSTAGYDAILDYIESHPVR